MYKSIILIEDDKALGETIVSFLEIKNYSVVHFLDGEKALPYIKNNVPDLILCDIVLPGITGLQVMKKLKVNKNTKLIPIIILSAVHYKITNREAFNIGSEDFITKPFNFKELEESIITRLDKHHEIKNTINGLEKEKIKLENKITELNYIINHKVRSSAAKIIQNKNLIEKEIQDKELKSLLIKETHKILSVTESSLPANKIPEKNTNSFIADKYSFFVVDDDIFYLKVIEKFFQSRFEKASIALFNKPAEALFELKKSIPTVIILDINMPEINGFEFLYEMQSQGLNDIPVIIHSSTSDPLEIKSITNIKNVKGFIGKPLKPELMEISISNILGNEI
jgi:DNA-binding response OmpR family regulator